MPPGPWGDKGTVRAKRQAQPPAEAAPSQRAGRRRGRPRPPGRGPSPGGPEPSAPRHSRQDVGAEEVAVLAEAVVGVHVRRRPGRRCGLRHGRAIRRQGDGTPQSTPGRHAPHSLPGDVVLTGPPPAPRMRRRRQLLPGNGAGLARRPTAPPSVPSDILVCRWHPSDSPIPPSGIPVSTGAPLAPLPAQTRPPVPSRDLQSLLLPPGCFPVPPRCPPGTAQYRPSAPQGQSGASQSFPVPPQGYAGVSQSFPVRPQCSPVTSQCLPDLPSTSPVSPRDMPVPPSASQCHPSDIPVPPRASQYCPSAPLGNLSASQNFPLPH